MSSELVYGFQKTPAHGQEGRHGRKRLRHVQWLKQSTARVRSHWSGLQVHGES